MPNAVVGMAILASSGGRALVDFLSFGTLFGEALVAFSVARKIVLNIRQTCTDQATALRYERGGWAFLEQGSFAFLPLFTKICLEGRTREALIVFRVFCAFL
jgi:hypothetical protein